MGLEGTAAISKLPTKAAPRRAAPVSTAARPPSPTLQSPGRAAANARARRHTQHQAQEAQQQNARGGDPGPRGAAPGARVGRDLPHLHAGGTGRRHAHVRVGCRLRVRGPRRVPPRRGRPGLSWRRRRRRERAPPRVARRALQGGAQEARLFLPAPLLFFSGGGRAHTRTRRGCVDGVGAIASTPSS